jgi:hypothetical protein
MPTTAQTAPQVGSAPQHGPQHDVILHHQSTDFALVVPIRAEVEILLDLDYDKPRVSLIILILFDMSLSYPIDAPGVERVVTRTLGLSTLIDLGPALHPDQLYLERKPQRVRKPLVPDQFI